MKLSKEYLCCIALGIASVCIPSLIYEYHNAVEALPTALEWQASNPHHGPWLTQWQFFFILPSVYILLLGAIVLMAVATIGSILIRSWLYFLRYGCLSVLYFAGFQYLLHGVFWTVG